MKVEELLPQASASLQHRILKRSRALPGAERQRRRLRQAAALQSGAKKGLRAVRSPVPGLALRWRYRRYRCFQAKIS